MIIQEIWQQLCVNVIATSWQEWTSTGLQIASVWYARKNNILVYPTGIIGVLLAAWLYYFVASPPLYADALLNIYYFIMSIYGWYSWVQKKNEAYVFPISWCSKRDWQWGLILFFISWLMIWFMLEQLTNSNTPLLDSLVSSTAVTAMWWMAKRKMENWIAWIVSNLVAIPLNFYKGFMLFTLMYVLFLILAISGYKEWKKKV
jgi:nicotinamide mononucleotide transporter